MRNVFDQYMQPENRVTHAFMTALNEDRRLLGLFLRELVKVKSPAPPGKLSVLEQQYPGEATEPAEADEAERRGIPDGWIFDEEGWCVFIECKVISPLGTDQLNRHRRTAERLGFRDITAVVITPTIAPSSLPPGAVRLEWRTVYAWLRRHASVSPWGGHAADYLEIAEAKMIDDKQLKEGTLTKFSGFPFGRDHPFTYLEGKRVLTLALAQLRGRRDLIKGLGMNPDAPGRPAITGRQRDSVWDFLSLGPSDDGETFTKHPHLTLGIDSRAMEAMVTVPNAVNTAMRRNLIRLEESGFQALVQEVVVNLKPLLRAHEGATPWFRGIQRRFPTQRSVPFIDARIEFDLRTAFPAGGPPKTQPRWLSAAYGSFVEKEGSNYQIQMGVVFRYEDCPELGDETATDLVAAAWLGCKPLVDMARAA